MYSDGTLHSKYLVLSTGTCKGVGREEREQRSEEPNLILCVTVTVKPLLKGPLKDKLIHYVHYAIPLRPEWLVLKVFFAQSFHFCYVHINLPTILTFPSYRTVGTNCTYDPRFISWKLLLACHKECFQEEHSQIRPSEQDK